MAGLRSSFISAATALFLFQGCTKPSPAPISDLSRFDRHSQISGPLVEEAEKILSHADVDPCLKERSASILEIARALDERKDKAFDAEGTGGSPGQFKRVSLGPIWMRADIVGPTEPEGWTETVSGWDDIIDHYQKMKSDPLNDTAASWFRLSAGFQYMLLDDLDRINGWSYDFDKSSEGWLAAVLKAVNLCLGSSSCRLPEINSELEIWIQSIPNLITRWKKVDLAQSQETRRVLLIEMRDFIERSLSGYLFVKNSSVVRESENLFFLPLDPGPFSEIQGELKKIIESKWQNSKFRLAVRWETQSGNNSVFAFEVGRQGQPAMVKRSQRKIILPPGVKITSIAHEIGHILGFRDKYYNIWKPGSCAYVNQSSDLDIMSNSTFDTAVVTDEEWQVLAENYPLSAK